MILNEFINLYYNLMSSISQVKKSPNSIQFKILNKDNSLDIALINAIRRIILVNLDIYAFSRDSINFQINTSIYNEDFISQRISLIPLNFKELEKLDHTLIEAYLDESNEDLIDFKKVYAKDLKIYITEGEDFRRPIDNIITIPDILLFQLKPNQKIKFSIKIQKGCHKEDGSMFCPVSKAVYFFENDEKALQEALKELPVEKRDEYRSIYREKFYLKNSSGSPSIYNFHIDCDDIIPVNELFARACDFLINLLKSKIQEIKNIEKSTDVTIETSPTNMIGFDFIFEKSDDTLGNLLQTYGLKDKEIHYIGYHVPHPLDRKLYVRLSLVNQESSMQNYERKVIAIAESVIGIVEKLKKDYLMSAK